MGFDLFNLGFFNYLFWTEKEENSLSETTKKSLGMGKSAKQLALTTMISFVVLFILIEKDLQASKAPKKEMKKVNATLLPLGEAKTFHLKYYTVKRGDTFPRISKKCYGESGFWQKIFEANQQKVSSPTKLRVGMRLYIPLKNPLSYSKNLSNP